MRHGVRKIGTLRIYPGRCTGDVFCARIIAWRWGNPADEDGKRPNQSDGARAFDLIVQPHHLVKSEHRKHAHRIKLASQRIREDNRAYRTRPVKTQARWDTRTPSSIKRVAQNAREQASRWAQATMKGMTDPMGRNCGGSHKRV